MHRLADTIATMPNIIRGLFATGTGAVASASPAVAEASTHWVQYAVWGATIFAGIATGLVALVRLYLDLRKEK